MLRDLEHLKPASRLPSTAIRATQVSEWISPFTNSNSRSLA